MNRVSLALLAVALAACQPRVASGPLDATYTDAFRVSGLSSQELNALQRASLSDADWHSLLRIGVRGQDGPPIAGRYEVTDDAVVFHPAFAPDAGREYLVWFDASKPPLQRRDAVFQKTIAMPAAVAAAPTVVTHLWPAAPVWPENLLRFYIHFSAPMSRTSAAGHVRLVDDTGREITDAILPMDLDLWNGDLTRYTVFFDPGRVKRGIRPNLELGRAMIAGRRYAIAVDATWHDAHGKPLAASFRHEFTAGPEETRAIDPAAWRLTPARAGSRDAVTVEFPWPLDRALLDRAIGVARAKSAGPVAGAIEVDLNDRRWRFTPAEPWPAGEYDLVVLTFLEDPAGNAVGRAFEMKNFLRSAAAAAQVESVKVPFVIE